MPAWLDSARIARRRDGPLDGMREPTSVFGTPEEVACRAYLKKQPFLTESGSSVVIYRMFLYISPRSQQPQAGDRVVSVTKYGKALIEVPLTIRSVAPLRTGSVAICEWRTGDAGSGSA